MEKMTEKTMNALYEYGKNVFEGHISINDAVEKMNSKHNEVAKSSAKHYISWYSKMRKGEFSTWRTNTKLLLYYIKRIIEEEGTDVGKTAMISAMKYAEYARQNELQGNIRQVATEHGISLQSGNDSPRMDSLDPKHLTPVHDYTWIAFYCELANKLLCYKNDRFLLVNKLVEIYDEIGMKLPRLEREGKPMDIDPFTIFGLFNKGISESNRISIIKAMAKIFDVKANVPSEFPGIPVLNNLKATFYYFMGERGDHDIDNLWELFETAIKYADERNEDTKQRFIKCFDAVLTQNGIRWNITMALFWIRPYSYIGLDSRNREFLKDKKYMPKDFVASVPKFDVVPGGETYLKLCDECRKEMDDNNLPFTNFPELSAYAWSVTKESEGGNNEEDKGAMGDADVKKTRYWMYSVFDDGSWAECQSKGIIVSGVDKVGDYTQYGSKEELRQALLDQYGSDSSHKNQALMAWNFARTIRPNDVIFAKRGNTLVGRGIVTGEYVFDDSRSVFKSIRNVDWVQIGKWDHPGFAAVKRLTDITPYTEYVEKLNAIFADTGIDVDVDENEKTYPVYSRDDFLSDVFMSETDYDTLVEVLENKKNIILQGAPGVGKTYAAKRLAYSLIGEKNPERVQMVQFHQSYSYEDFIEGYRPASKGADGADFVIKKGSFYKFCKKAADDDENDYFFIIDEINRGNLSKIFGELFMLVESDKRGVELQLLYSDEKFFVPRNVYIIGMMNTADRSLAMLDYALRRRFSFIEMKPGFDTDGFVAYQENLHNEKFDSLVNCVRQLNVKIAEDTMLGEGFCIGHSYFCNIDQKKIDNHVLNAVVEFELIPLLKEYWFDENDKINEWQTKLRNAIK